MNQRRRGSRERAVRRRMRGRQFGRQLRAELLEPRIALHGEALLAGELAQAIRPFPTGLNHADPLVRAAIAGVTTTAPAEEYFLDEVVLGPAAGGAELPQESLEESGALIGLPAFRTDPRFAGIDGSGYSVVILDSGIDLDHPFFGPDTNGDLVADRILFNADFISGQPNADDTRGHGTHVSSIAVSQDATYRGVASGSGIIHLRVIDDLGFGTAQAIESALQWVVANAATYNVASVNMSLSFGDNASSATTRPDLGLSDELAALAAQGVITVSASGNSFFGYGSAPGVSYPSADPNSLSVGAVWDATVEGPVEWASGGEDYTTAPDRVTSFSQRHPTLTTVFAPGAQITAAAIGGGVSVRSGTSMAAPHIAGMAAVMQQLAVQTTSERLSPSEFADLLDVTGVSIFDGDDEDDNVINTELEFRRADMVAMANALVSGGLSDLALAGEITARSSSAPTGGRVRLDLAIGNQGPAAAGAFTSKIYLSADEVIDSSDILLATLDDELGGGQSNRRTGYVVDLPSTVAAGSYFLGIVLDDQSAVAEADEQNNVEAIPITVTDAVPDMWIQDLSSDSAKALGSGATVDFGQMLSGGADSSKTFRIYNDGSTELALIGLTVPAGYSVSGFPATVAPLETAEFDVSLLAGGGDAQFAGEISFTTNDGDSNPFTLMVTGIVDHGATTAAAGSISANSSVSAAIATPDDADWYRFNAVRNVEYRIETLLGTLPDSIIRIRDAAGNELAVNDDSETGLHSTLIWTAPSDSAFYIEVVGKSSSTGTYQLSLAAGDNHGNDAASATLTTDPSVNAGAIEGPGDVDWFAFTASAGVDYRFEAAAETLPAASLQLFDADGTTLLAPAESGPAEAVIAWTAPADGTYYLAVAGASPGMIGSYRLLITGEDDHGDNAANATLLGAPGSAVGDMEEQDDVDWFAFDAVAGASYEFAADAQGSADTVLRLIGRDGVTELDRDGDDGQGPDSQLQWTAPVSGRYFIEISGIGQQHGEYTLTLSIQDDHGNDAAAATSTTDPSDNLGVIASGADVDWFAFEAIAGVSYRVEQSAGALSEPSLSVIDSDGQTVLATSAPGSSAVEWIAPQSGAFYFTVAAASGAQLGDYAVRLTGEDDHGDNAVNATPLIIPGNMAGILQGADDRDWFSFTSVAGLNYRFEATLGAPGIIRLYEPDGVTLISEVSGQEGAPAILEWTAAAGDRYFLETAELVAVPATDSLPPAVNYSLRAVVVGRVPGDYDVDSNVDGHDFLLWQRSVDSTSDLRADGNNDGAVDGADLSYWGERYGLAFGGPASALSRSAAAVEAQALADAGEPLGQSAPLPWLGELDGKVDEAWQAERRDMRRGRTDHVTNARDLAMARWRLDDRLAAPFVEARHTDRSLKAAEQAPSDEEANHNEDWRDDAFAELLEPF